MKSYTILLLFLFAMFIYNHTTRAMLEKSPSITFKDLDISIRKGAIKITHKYLRSVFLSRKECYDLIKVIAITGDSNEHIELIKKMYEYLGMLFIKKPEHNHTVKNLDPYKEGERLIAEYREKDCNKTDIGYALLHNHSTIFAFLMQSNNKKFLQKHGCDLAQSAVMLGRLEPLKILFDNNIDIDCPTGIHDNSIWHTATTVKNDNSVAIFEVIKTYYEKKTNKKIDISIQNNNKETPLMSACGQACRYIRSDIVAYLLQHKSDPNTQDIHGSTPLHRAALWECPETIALLLKAGADPNAQDNNKNTPLHIACDHLNVKSAYTLIRSKKNLINAQNNNGETALHILLKKKNLDEKESFKQKNIILFLLNAGAHMDILNKQGFAPLHYSAEALFIYQKKYLKPIERHNKKMNWSLEQAEGETLLHQLIKKTINAHSQSFQAISDVIQFLLEKGVSPLHEDKKKETPSDLVTKLMNYYEAEYKNAGEQKQANEKELKKLFEYYTSISLLFSVALTIKTNFENMLSKKTRDSLRKSLKKE